MRLTRAVSPTVNENPWRTVKDEVPSPSSSIVYPSILLTLVLHLSHTFTAIMPSFFAEGKVFRRGSSKKNKL